MTPSTTGPLDLTPRDIVSALDRYIIGQKAAKRAVALALRNRWRRQQIPGDLRDEIMPKNIIMIGPTGVGKTEIARRLSKLARAPFLKVEASKFTEVGYVGRDVESIVRDLVEVAIDLVRSEEQERVRERARDAAEERILSALGADFREQADVLRKLRAGELDDEEIEFDLSDKKRSTMKVFTTKGGVEEMDLGGMLGGVFAQKPKSKKKMKVRDARRALEEEEGDKLINQDAVVQEALSRAENHGVVFLDEIDKVAVTSSRGGVDVSRAGVQRDLLPIVEGCTVRTKHGAVKTDHVLFIAAGAFHLAKPSDLIPELQGRFPIRVELENLEESDFVRILTEPRASLIKQYVALMATEGLSLRFEDDAVAEIARVAAQVNARLENIGARRLHTVMERVLDELSFKAPEMDDTEISLDRTYVREMLKDVMQDEDLGRYVL